jgi:hypothetical protein
LLTSLSALFHKPVDELVLAVFHKRELRRSVRPKVIRRGCLHDDRHRQGRESPFETEGYCMNIRKKLSFGMGAVALAAALIFGQAATASAAPATPTAASVIKYNFGDGPGCPSKICLWSENNFHGNESLTIWSHKLYNFGSSGNIPDMGKLVIDDYGTDMGMQDIASSVVDNTDSAVCFYSDNWYAGANFQIHGWEKWASLPSWINDKISSFAYC